MEEPGRRPRGGQAAFSLLEMIAVVIVFGLVAAVALPNLAGGGDRKLWNAAGSLTAELEWARQRTVMTGIPHRVLLDLEEGRTQLQWLRRETAEPRADVDEDGRPVVHMAPPERAAEAFQPIPAQLGRPVTLEASVAFHSVESDGGVAESGLVAVEFESDGTTEPVTIFLENDRGLVLALEVAALSDAIRIHDVD